MTDLDPEDLPWTVILPQKDLRRAKSRMRLSDSDRRSVVMAMFTDTLDAVRGCPGVVRIIVVCDNADDAIALGREGIITQVDGAGGGLNPSIEVGAELARELLPTTHLAVLPADLPGLRPAELARALAIAAGHDRSFIADAAGTGTTLLTAISGHELRPAYGVSSRARHTLMGAVEIGRGNDLESLRDDVDDVDALRRVIGSDRAPKTRRVLAGLHTEKAIGLRRGMMAP